MAAKKPLIASPALRSLFIGAAMLGLFLGSLTLAWGLTGAPILPPSAAEPQRFGFEGVEVAVPWAWQLESVVAGVDKRPRRWDFVNSASPAERLRVERYETTAPVEPQLVLNTLITQQRLVAGLIFNRNEADPLPVGVVNTETGEALETFFAIERRARVQTSPQLHAVWLYTPDRRRYWLLHLTDQVPRERFSPQVESGHREQLRRIADTLRYDPAAASAASP